MLKLRGSTILRPTTTANHKSSVRPCRGAAQRAVISISSTLEFPVRVCVCVHVCMCVCVCDLYFLRGRSLCSHEMAGVFGSVCCCLFAPVIHPFCGIRTSVCVRLGNLGAGPSVAADCFRIRRLYQPLWNRGWWGGRGWRFGPPPLGGGRRWGLVWRPQRGLTCL